MNKGKKQEPTGYKFDTSKGNLACFMRSTRQKESSPARRPQSRRKSKVKKAPEFQEKVFLENILNKVLIEEFSSPLELKQLIEQNNASELQDANVPKRESEWSNMNGLSECNYKSIILSCQDCYEMQQCSTQLQSPSEEKAPEQSLEMFTSVMETHQNYTPFPYYLPQTYYYSQQRKKKTASEEQAEYKIVLDRIQQDGRTTLMIRHIPNKYSEQMLLEEINRNHRLKFNFLYLPIDYCNSCNVGYAFVNFIDTKFVPEFYSQFNGKKWNKFNSEKICELAYARIQGTTSLMDHFQNSTYFMQMREKRKQAGEDAQSRHEKKEERQFAKSENKQ